jgi:crossover junction endodeoxyribonuclease RuvC
MEAKKERIILGVDPGLHISGFGIAREVGSSIQLLDRGILKMNPTKPLPERIGIFYEFFQQKISAFPLTAIALETPFLGKNTQSFLKLGYLRGCLYLMAHQHKLELYEFAPTQVKQSVTGWGGASKEQVATLMHRLFPQAFTKPANPLIAKPDPYDLTDALAVTLCGVWKGGKEMF